MVAASVSAWASDDQAWRAMHSHQAALRLRPVGDCALLVDFASASSAAGRASEIEDDILARVHRLDAALSAAGLRGIIEQVVGYTSLLVICDPVTVDYEVLASSILRLSDEPPPRRSASRGRRWRVPVCYGGPFGPDLDESAARLSLSPSELVAAYAGATYTIAMFGFLPGFAYLSGLPPALALPRRATPRPRIFSGSIAIGGAQTAIGSIEGPSGWNLIGRTPLRTFDAVRCPSTLFEPGDEIRLVPAAWEVFDDLAARAAAGGMLAERVA